MDTTKLSPLNLLNSDLSEAEIAALFVEPRPALLPGLGSDAWTRTAANPHVRKVAAPFREIALAEIDQPLPILTDELYADFHLTGTRLTFERVYFERRRRLARAAISGLLATGDEQQALLRSTVAKLTDIFEERSWALPAHVGTETGIDPMRLDLFGCETANLMAEMLTVFGDVIPENLARAIKERLRKEYFENFVANAQSFFWYAHTNNWNAVCHQGILGAALGVEADADLVAKVIVTMRAGLPNFLKGFGDDGGCSEGPGYWSYGFGWFSFLNEQLEFASRGRLSVVEGDAKVRECAMYAPRAQFSNGYVINFADGPARASYNPHVLGYLGQRLGLPALVSASQAEYRALAENGFDTHALRMDFFYLARVLLDFPTELGAATAEFGTKDYFFPDLQVITARRSDTAGNLWEFAAKGGHNEEHHNHNDCGNYILHVNGQPVVTEIGAPEYNAAFFGPNRYQVLAARTLGHSLPIVNGVEQAAGYEFAAKILAHDLDAETVSFALDLTKAYPESARLNRLVRRFELDAANGGLAVTDEYDLAEGTEFETAVCTNQAVDLTGALPAIVSGDVRVAVHSADTTASVKTHEYIDHKGYAASIERLTLKPTVPAASGTVRYILRIAQSG